MTIIDIATDCARGGRHHSISRYLYETGSIHAPVRGGLAQTLSKEGSTDPVFVMKVERSLSQVLNVQSGTR
jgi:hypothetical protein